MGQWNTEIYTGARLFVRCRENYQSTKVSASLKPCRGSKEDVISCHTTAVRSGLWIQKYNQKWDHKCRIWVARNVLSYLLWVQLLWILEALHLSESASLPDISWYHYCESVLTSEANFVHSPPDCLWNIFLLLNLSQNPSLLIRDRESAVTLFSLVFMLKHF